MERNKNKDNEEPDPATENEDWVNGMFNSAVPSVAVAIFLWEAYISTSSFPPSTRVSFQVSPLSSASNL